MTGNNGSQPFKRREKIRLDALGDEFPNHAWTFWSSPTPDVWLKLLGPSRYQDRVDTGKPWNDEEYQQAEGEYFEAIAEIVLDTGESGLDLSTPEAVRSAFFNGQCDVELLGAIVTAYTVRIAHRFQDMQKKVQARSAATAGNSTKSRQASKSRRSS